VNQSEYDVGANKLSGAIYHVSPAGVERMDALNNLFAQIPLTRMALT